MISDASLLKVIKNVGPAVHPARLERAFLLSEVVKRNGFERNIIQIEITPEIKMDFDEPRKPAPENPAAGYLLRQPAQRAQGFERGIFRVIDKIAPVSMLHRPAPGE